MALDYKKVEIQRPYESVIIMDPEASEAEQKALFQKNKGIVEAAKGEVYSVETWGKRSLANEINKKNLGIYFHSYFQASPEVIVELERTMKINEKVILYLHNRLSEKESVSKHSESYKAILAESTRRQKEFEAKIQKKKAARANSPRGPRKPFNENRDRDRDRDRGPAS